MKNLSMLSISIILITSLYGCFDTGHSHDDGSHSHDKNEQHHDSIN